MLSRPSPNHNARRHPIRLIVVHADASPPAPDPHMDIPLPVYLYDVVTTDATPRFIVACRTEQAALDLATRLNEAPRDGVETFTVATRRVAMVAMPVEPGSSVVVRGYEVASDVLAAAIATIPPPPDPAPVEPVP